MASLAPRGLHLCAPSNHRPRPHGHVARTTQSRHSQSMGHVFTIRRNVLSALRESIFPLAAGRVSVLRPFAPSLVRNSSCVEIHGVPPV